jgi:hypothetical protein
VPEYEALDSDLKFRLRDAFRRRDREAATTAASKAYGISIDTAAN